jgi:hypothetical protein
MSTDKKEEVWLAAYSAALTGFLGSGKPIDNAKLKASCIILADQAVEDFEERWYAESPEPFRTRLEQKGGGSPRSKSK